jgi:FixJ family two-component response regulator
VTKPKDKILIIDADPGERSALVAGVLEPSGYQVYEAGDGPSGLSLALSEGPDLIIMEMDLEGLSGQDLLVALNSQGFDAPVIITSYEGPGDEVLQAFRLGAADYLHRPFKDAEVVAAVERALEGVRLRREHEELALSLREANQQLEQRLREMQTLADVGKFVASITRLDDLFEKTLGAAIELTGADKGGFMLRDDDTGRLVLRADHNLGPALSKRIGQFIEDGLANLVITSREALIASGDGLRRFRQTQDAHAVIYVPLVVQNNAVGVLWVGNQQRDVAFEERHKDLLTALADYVVVGVVNAKLFGVLDQRARRLEEALRKLRGQEEQAAISVGQLDAVLDPLRSMRGDLLLLQGGEMGELSPAQQASVDVLMHKVERALASLEAVTQAGS